MATVCCADSEDSAEKRLKVNSERPWEVIKVGLLLPISFSEFPVNSPSEMVETNVIATDDMPGVPSDDFIIVGCESDIMEAKSTDVAKISNSEKKSAVPESELSTEQVKGDHYVVSGKENLPDPFEDFKALPRKTFSTDDNVVSKRKQRLEKRKLRKDNASSKRRWRDVPLEEMGINPTLFPRRPIQFEPDEKTRKLCDPIAISYEVDQEFMHIENILSNTKDLEHFLAIGVKDIRADRHRKIKRAHKQVKNKYCSNVQNNNGKKLYVNHRVFKRMELKARTIHFLPKTKAGARSDLEKTRIINRKETGKTNASVGRTSAFEEAKPRPPVASETRHALHSQNAPATLAEDQALVNLLISLQHRDLSPEDYDLLLRLDEQVAPKTVSKNLLSTFKTDNVQEADCCQQCAVCMENYVLGQLRKFLPCQHVFHASCIDMWLENSSLNCPLDGLPVT